MTEDAATRVGRLIRERRKSLNLTQADIQAAGGPSTTTLRLIEGGKHTDFRPSTSQPLEKALHWAPGSIAAILEGKGRSVPGVIQGRTGPIETFNAVEGSEQHNLRRLRLAAIIMDARELVQSQPGPLMTALASILDEASELVIKVLAEDDDDLADARWRIDQVRAGNSIRRLGSIYVTDTDSVGGLDIAQEMVGAREARQLLRINLVRHYTEMMRQALPYLHHNVLAEQAREELRPDSNSASVIKPELPDNLYVQYLAARLSTPAQGGDPDLHDKVLLTPEEYDAARSQYQREFAEMALFRRLRTVGAPPRRSFSLPSRRRHGLQPGSSWPLSIRLCARACSHSQWSSTRPPSTNSIRSSTPVMVSSTTWHRPSAPRATAASKAEVFALMRDAAPPELSLAARELAAAFLASGEPDNLDHAMNRRGAPVPNAGDDHAWGAAV